MHTTRLILLILTLCSAAVSARGQDQAAPVAKLLPPIPDAVTPVALPLAPPQLAQDALPFTVMPPAAAPRYTLPDLIALASANYPELAAARACADFARGKLVQAGLYPNPYVSMRSDEIGNPQGSLGFLAMTVTQEIVTANKLKLAREAQAHGVAAMDWQAITRWFDVLTRLRLSYVDVLTAQQEVRAYQEIVKLSTDGYEAAVMLRKKGQGTEPDVLRARVELEQSNIRLGVAQRRAEASWRQLTLSVGLPRLEYGELAGRLDSPSPDFDWQPLVDTVMVRSSEIQEAQALNRLAEGLWRRAKVEPIPNVLVQVRPMYAAPERNMELMVEVGGYMPFFNRNQGNITAAQADIHRTAADVRTVELRLGERLNVAYQRYLAARQQVEAYRSRILPDAEKSLQLVRLGYDKGEARFDYTAVLQAQVILSQAKLVYTQALGELWRSVTDVAGLVQDDRLEVADSCKK